MTYSNLDWGEGALYEKFGMVYKGYTSPGYYYIVDGIRSHRFNWTKQKLVELGYDSNKTELEIMYDLGYYRCWNSGNFKYEINL